MYRIKIISYKAVGKIGSELIHSLNHWALIMSSSDEISHFHQTGDACVRLLIVIKSLICALFLTALGWGVGAASMRLFREAL